MKKVFIFIIVLFSVFLFSNFALAQSGQGGGPGALTPVNLENPLGLSNPTPQTLLGTIIKAVLGIVGSLALVMFIYGGVTWMLAAGNAERVTKGKNILIWATIGLVVIFSAYALVTFVFKGIGALP